MELPHISKTAKNFARTPNCLKRRLESRFLPSAIISFPTISRRFWGARRPQVLRAFEPKAVDCRSGISPKILSLRPILSKAVDFGNLVRTFNTLFLNDNLEYRIYKVRVSPLGRERLGSNLSIEIATLIGFAGTGLSKCRLSVIKTFGTFDPVSNGRIWLIYD